MGTKNLKWLRIIFVSFVVVAPTASSEHDHPVTLEKIRSSVDDVNKALSKIQADVDILKEMNKLLKEIKASDEDAQIRLVRSNRKILPKLDQVIGLLQSTILVCTHLKCRNGGTCLKISGTAKCYCPSGYYGNSCEKTIRSTPVDVPCKKVCYNGGACFVRQDQKEVCKCTDVYGGDECKDRIKCIRKVCLNGGTCAVVNGNEEVCTCTKGYIGDTCDIEVCHRRQCHNGGTCYKVNGIELCHCTKGFFGVDCTIVVPTAPPTTTARVTTTSKPKLEYKQSCENWCNKQGRKLGGNCYCDGKCRRQGDCCKDYNDLCGSDAQKTTKPAGTTRP